MGDIEILKHSFAIGFLVRFEKLADGVVVAEIDNSLAIAIISLYGGHVVSWRPKHQDQPVLWVSKLAQFKLGKAIRGGVPICWPWCASVERKVAGPRVRAYFSLGGAFGPRPRQRGDGNYAGAVRHRFEPRLRATGSGSLGSNYGWRYA